MIVITCLDDRGGVMFNRRRQSQDRILRERIASMTAGGRLWMSRYSAGQFEGEALPNLTVDDDFLQKAVLGALWLKLATITQKLKKPFLTKKNWSFI